MDFLAEEFNLETIELAKTNLTELPLEHIPATLLQQHEFLPIKLEKNRLSIAISDPSNIQLLNELKFLTQFELQLILADFYELKSYRTMVLQQQDLHLKQKTEQHELAKIVAEIVQETTSENEQASNDNSPIARFIKKILAEAVQQNASDIHFETYQHNFRIRFRIDGVLHIWHAPPLILATRIITRLKIMAQLNIAERRLPQDGRCQCSLLDREINLRVSTCPTINGEKVVLRILESLKINHDIASLGLLDLQQSLVLSALQQPQGMILVTGPTGSGKTVTLYTALQLLNKTERNLASVEDPVEIYLNGINQVNINLKTGLDFPIALRAFLRQDPDIIMIGEIRDLITTEIALKAAQTGHLVLSTLHTNNTSETIIRLLQMGIMPYQVASSVSLIIAQRLVRKLCEFCKLTADPSIQFPELAQHYRANGCDRCKSGYSGRIGIYEIMPVNNKLQEIILRDSNILELKKQALADGMIDLMQAGLNKVEQGITSLEELFRVVKH